jgi:hypothetical protein
MMRDGVFARVYRQDVQDGASKPPNDQNCLDRIKIYMLVYISKQACQYLFAGPKGV